MGRGTSPFVFHLVLVNYCAKARLVFYPNKALAVIYADDGISGTNTKKREDFIWINSFWISICLR